MTPRPPIHPYEAWDRSSSLIQFTPDPIGNAPFWRATKVLDSDFPWLHDASQEAGAALVFLCISANAMSRPAGPAQEE